MPENTLTIIGQDTHTRKCFVISPIGNPGTDIRDDADAVLKYIIVPALARIASDGGPVIDAVRSDQIGVPGRIEQHMLKAILSYDLCIADLSGLNPNVMYELAIAQSAGRPVVLMCRSGETLPFDVKDYRTIVYDLKPRSMKEDTWIPKVIEHVLAVLADDYSPPRLLEGYDHIREGTQSYLLNSQSQKFEAPRYNEVVGRTQYRCDLMGISLTSWKLKASRDVLENLGIRKVRTRILTMDPGNPALPHMINEGRTSATLTSVKESATRMNKFFQSLVETYDCFETRIISSGLPHVQLIITDETALVVQYMYARGTPESPMLQLPKDTELYGVFADEFEELWQLNQPRVPLGHVVR